MFQPILRQMPIYVIYDPDTYVWSKAYTSFTDALIAVQMTVSLYNDTHVASDAYVPGAPLPGQMITYTIDDVGTGILVATLSPGDVRIYIKMLDVV
jgi:hypothetical protein